MATFTDVYKQELKTKGVLSSLGSTAFKRTKERLDPRNMLFGGSGMMAATGRKIFGKGYQALDRTPGKKLSESGGFSGEIKSEALNSLLISSQKQEAQLSIIAKNTMNSNAMARDMNVMRQNVMKLVTMGGGKASRGADMFFKDSAAREKAYESQFGKEKGKTSPTPVNKTDASKEGGNKGILGALLGIGTTIATAVTGALGSIPSLLSSIFSAENIGKIFGIGLDVMKGLGSVFRLLMPILTNPVFLGIAAALIGANWLMDFLAKKNEEANTEEKTDLRKAQDRGSNSSKLAARTLLIDEGLKSLLDKDRTDADVSDYTRGEIKTKKELAEAIASAQESGRNVIQIKNSSVQAEAQDKLHGQALQSMEDGSMANAEARRFGVKSTSPTPATPEPSTSTSPTPVGMGNDGAFKSKEDFLKAMYPLAVKASKELGGVDPNALLTQWGFESGWGSKVSGKYNYFGIKADPSWKGDKKDVMTHEYISGEKVRIPQPFRSYSNPEEAVNDYVKFLKNNKRYTKAGVFNTKTSGEFFSALQSAGYATDPNYANKLTSATEGTAKQTAQLMSAPSTTGTALASGSTAASDMKLSLSSQPPTIVVSAPTTVTNGASTSPAQQVASALNNDAMELFFQAAVGVRPI
jgi:flagellar rod assembly protein/muramidase FlgJ